MNHRWRNCNPSYNPLDGGDPVASMPEQQPLAGPLGRVVLIGLSLLTAWVSSAQAARAKDGILDFNLETPSFSVSSNPWGGGEESPTPPISPSPHLSISQKPHPPIPQKPQSHPSTEVALSFEPPPLLARHPATAEPDPPIRAELPKSEAIAASSTWFFQGGPDSLVAKAVGSAEGTRTPEGDRTRAYYGHVDPGNGVWNLGSFSYQHGATSPEEADAKQLQRLQGQAQVLRHQAEAIGIVLTLEEELNGIDLANQSPRAALDRGYIGWLKRARDLGMDGSDAILWARTRSFLDPDSGRWNAPGLGNNVHSITRDQERRMRAIARAIDVYQQNQIKVQAPETFIEGAIATPASEPPSVDQIVFFDLSFKHQ